jgi:hypothetical protein
MMDKSVRSQSPTIKLDQLVYVELESSNGGMMLTVSEDGFSFRAVTPVRPNGRIPFSFVINGTEKLEGFGKIAWTKDDGKVAGLQFTDVTTEFLNALRKWLAQLSAPAVPSFSDASSDNANGANGKYPRALETSELAAAEPATEGVSVQPLPELGFNFGQSLRGVEPRNGNDVGRVSPRGLPAIDPPGTTPMVGEWNYPSGLPNGPRPRFHGLTVMAAVICFVALAVILYAYREAIGQSLISVGQKMSATSETSQSQPSKPSDPAPPAIGAQTPAAASPSKDQERVPSSSGSLADISNNPPNIPPATKPDNTFQDTRPSPTANEPLRDDSRGRGSAEQVRSLWSAVSQGNTSAEVTLARLYLIGGGVPKSCDQARVLLQAAARKGNGEAVDKLSQINRQGCP